MPKKVARNSFYYFMHDFKEEQRKKGINYANLTEVQQAADPVWRQMTQSQKAKFEDIAKKEKAKYNIPEQKFTAQGIPFSEIERQERARQEAEESELKEIKNFVKLKGFNKRILEEDIFLIDVNSFCRANNRYLIGESTVLRFSLADGIKDFYHESINPGIIPVGYASDVKFGAEELGLEKPDSDRVATDYMQVLANIIDYLKQSAQDTKVLPPLYTLPEKVDQVQDFIIQMCIKASEDDSIFRIYKLDMLFFHLINEIKSHQNEGFPRMTLATAQLKRDSFKYTAGLGCELHEEGTKQVECSLARVKRWAYTIFDSCCPVAGIEPVPGNHLPRDVDVDTVLQTKETKKDAWKVPSHQHMTPSLNDSFSSNVTVKEEQTEKPKEVVKRQHKQLRQPKTDYSNLIRPPPEITEDEFPALMSSAGRGRGRGTSTGTSYSSVAGGSKGGS